MFYTIGNTIQSKEFGKTLIIYPALHLALERAIIIHNVGHSLHTLAPHTGIGSLQSALTLLCGEVTPHLTYGAGKASKARSTSDSTTQVG